MNIINDGTVDDVEFVIHFRSDGNTASISSTDESFILQMVMTHNLQIVEY
ncbi:hypothetical protein FDI40_gp029 [Agrobacterium phage Atu_ph07]|uniref:Uncharacterized protein n=1 Tax=Agrobacterium phage Atu_ph07 TaxID=2024264 RepID=A0A2L0UZ89_9CAUD|nr:hypothetical protein FDI40_gp029 [Agrobacterium phage Atu_ph07]AUZ94841.1 hypothetical protein [Agrobacterium phage Atu_ph07]